MRKFSAVFWIKNTARLYLGSWVGLDGGKETTTTFAAFSYLELDCFTAFQVLKKTEPLVH